MTHLWEVEHPYYCNDGNYYARESVVGEFKRWSDFIDDYGDSDFDMNLIFRFDWKEDEDHAFNGDANYRNGLLCIYWMGQRKGLFHISHVEVCRADEPAVIEFLQPRFAHMLKLWEPFDRPLTQETASAYGGEH